MKEYTKIIEIFLEEAVQIPLVQLLQVLSLLLTRFWSEEQRREPKTSV